MGDHLSPCRYGGKEGVIKRASAPRAHAMLRPRSAWRTSRSSAVGPALSQSCPSLGLATARGRMVSTRQVAR